MGKGKGKKGHAEEKAKVRAARKAKAAMLPKPAKPLKKEKIKKVKKPNTNPPGPAAFPIPMGRPKPFTKSPQHAKWPSLFKRHLGVIEAHIRNLDRVMQSMQSEMGEMAEDEKLRWELGEKGNWRVICEMMDRAREVLTSAREAAKGILPARQLKDKKGLGVAGTNFEPMGPKLAERAAALGITKENSENILGVSHEQSEDTEMSDSSDDSDSDSDSNSGSASSSDSESNEDIEESFVPTATTNTKKRKISESSEADDSMKKTVEPNPYFVIDTNPTPVAVNGVGPAKKQRKERKPEKRPKNVEVVMETVVEPVMAEETVVVEPDQSAVDFDAVEAQLQAEVAAGIQAQLEEEEVALRKLEKKKRKRSSTGAHEDVVVKKIKKSKKSTPEEVDDSEVAPPGNDDVVNTLGAENVTVTAEVKSKSKSKKDKKRKSPDAEELGEPKIKKTKVKEGIDDADQLESKKTKKRKAIPEKEEDVDFSLVETSEKKKKKKQRKLEEGI